MRSLAIAAALLTPTLIRAQKAVFEEPQRDHSPLGTFLLRDSRQSSSDVAKHYKLIAHREQPDKSYDLYAYPRYADLHFSPDEQYLVIDDQFGIGATRCMLLSRVAKPPFYLPVRSPEIDDRCWALFWSQHRKPSRPVRYTHRQTYFCEWLDNSHFFVGLQGNNQLDTGRWSLDGGWHCVYDALKSRAVPGQAYRLFERKL